MQNLRLVNFILESRLPLILHQSVAFTEKRTQKTESGINDGFEKMELKFSVFNNFFIPTRETGLPIPTFGFSWKFSSETTEKSSLSFTFHLLPWKLLEMIINL